MTQDELRKKLNEVAEWRMPKLSETVINESKKRSRGRKSAEQRYQEEHEEIFLDIFQGINPTHIPEMVKMHIKPQDCEDCGKHLTESRVKEIKYYAQHSGHIAHKRERCKNCNKYKDPRTGQYDLLPGPACQVFLNWAKSQYTLKIKLTKTDADK